MRYLRHPIKGAFHKAVLARRRNLLDRRAAIRDGLRAGSAPI